MKNQKLGRYGCLAVRANNTQESQTTCLIQDIEPCTVENYTSLMKAINSPSNVKEGDNFVHYLNTGKNELDAFIGKYKYGRRILYISNFTTKSEIDSEIYRKLKKWAGEQNAVIDIYAIDGADLDQGLVDGYTPQELQNRMNNKDRLMEMQHDYQTNELALSLKWFENVSMEMFTQRLQYPRLMAKGTTWFELNESVYNLPIDDSDNRVLTFEMTAYQFLSESSLKVKETLKPVHKTEQGKFQDTKILKDHVIVKPGEDESEARYTDATNLQLGYKLCDQYVNIEEENQFKDEENLTEDQDGGGSERPSVSIQGCLDTNSQPQLLMPSRSYSHYLVCHSTTAEVKLTAICLSLKAEGLVALVRYKPASSKSASVTNAQARMGVLLPYIHNEQAQFVFRQLPFYEDVRYHVFPSLSEPKSVYGKPLEKDSAEYQKLMPDETSTRLFGELIDKMPLTEIPSEAYDISNYENILEDAKEYGYDPNDYVLIQHLQDKDSDIYQGKVHPKNIVNPKEAYKRYAIKKCFSDDSYNQAPDVPPELFQFLQPLNETQRECNQTLNDLLANLNIKKVLTSAEQRELEQVDQQAIDRELEQRKNEEIDMDIIMNDHHDDGDSGDEQGKVQSQSQEVAAAAASQSQDQQPPQVSGLATVAARAAEFNINVPDQIHIETPQEDFQTRVESFANSGEHVLLLGECKRYLDVIIIKKCIEKFKGKMPFDMWKKYLKTFVDEVVKYDINGAEDYLYKIIQDNADNLRLAKKFQAEAEREFTSKKKKQGSETLMHGCIQ